MSDCQDMTTALARELTNGIEGEVEDLGAVFKKMAILKPVVDVPQSDVIEGTAAIVGSPALDVAVSDGDTAVAVISTQMALTEDSAAQSTNEQNKPKQSNQSSGLLALLHDTKPKKASRKKAANIMENQMSLFDLIEDTA